MCCTETSPSGDDVSLYYLSSDNSSYTFTRAFVIILLECSLTKVVHAKTGLGDPRVGNARLP